MSKGNPRYSITVNGVRRRRRLAPTTPAKAIASWKRQTAAKLERQRPAPRPPRPATDTVAADIEGRYLLLIGHLHEAGGYRRAEIRAWMPFIGHKRRQAVTREDVLIARSLWLAAGLKPATVNNRVIALRDFYRKLDGDDIDVPYGRIRPLQLGTPPPPTVIPVDVINAVVERLRTSRAKHAAQDCARLMVLASTGRRPCELERAEPGDVDLGRRVWKARTAKGGFSPGTYLNEDMVTAWEAFIEADAWGPIHKNFGKSLRKHGWPVGVRAYNLRHSTWIDASDRGFDLADIQAAAGHTQIATTRRHYVPVRGTRMQALAEGLQARGFNWRQLRLIRGGKASHHDGSKH
jgi:integrase